MLFYIKKIEEHSIILEQHLIEEIFETSHTGKDPSTSLVIFHDHR